MSRAICLDIVRLGQRGEGVAEGPGGPVYVPDALPGEQILVEIEGERGRGVEILRASPDRIAPICVYFGTCGGCAVQSLSAPAYRAWKRELVVTALSMGRVEAVIQPMVAAHGDGRRRATFHARARDAVNILAETPPVVGFMEMRAHTIVDIAACPILTPGMAGALPAARAIAAALAPLGKPLDILVTSTLTGLDVDLRGCGRLDPGTTARVVAAAKGCARLSNHGEILIETRAPELRMGQATLTVPPGCFLQPTEAGEQALADLVLGGVSDARRVLDLFSGVGTFALRLAERATVHAVELEPRPLAALAKAARANPVLRPVTVETRDLFRRPFAPSELAQYDAVVFDPPRAGAAAQAEQLAHAKVPVVVAVSCNPASFARDAALLVGGGYALERVTPVDQFLYAAHVELVAVFRRTAQRAGRRRSLLS